ncbi:hypothetical protein M5689_005898 [Euphorbia peplus]|nr:hypothetical protein M5689_005898 [Euphorbia peplus]
MSLLMLRKLTDKRGMKLKRGAEEIRRSHGITGGGGGSIGSCDVIACATDWAASLRRSRSGTATACLALLSLLHHVRLSGLDCSALTFEFYFSPKVG